MGAVFVDKLCIICTQNVLKIDCEYIILNELFVPVSGYLMRVFAFAYTGTK